MRSRPGGNEPTQVRAWLDSRGLGSWRVRLAAFGLSVALHLLAVVLYSSFMRVIRPDAVTFQIPAATESEQGVDVVRLLELDESGEPEEPDEPEEIEDVEAAEADARAPVIVDTGVGELVPPGPTAAERLRPNLTNPRLWAALPPEFYELTLEEQEELLVSARIVEWYDSLMLAEAAEGRLTDWTFRDGQGGRWGVADGKIYLGDLALPLPINFGTPVGKRDETNRRIWEFEEISRQSQRYLIEQTWKERAEATRQRRDRERSQARDTIGIR
jgi:hypothetical protein